MAHRIRWALGQEPIASALKGIFEIDELWIGGKQRIGPVKDTGEKNPRWLKNVNDNKTPVTTILHRDGDVRSYPKITGEQLRPILSEMVAEILVRHHQNFKTCRFGQREQLAIFHTFPPARAGLRHHVVVNEMAGQRSRRAVVKQNQHQGRGAGASVLCATNWSTA